MKVIWISKTYSSLMILHDKSNSIWNWFIGSDLIKISVNSYNFIIILFVREHVHTLRTKIFWKKATKHDNRTLRGQKVFFE